MVDMGGSAAWVPTAIDFPAGYGEEGLSNWPTFWLVPLHQGEYNTDLGLDVLMQGS